ncbi:MAG TPA: hypothetical protein VFG68_20415, partial [Fimbriiglobus sp.]|nr:hypothetical protein [Fimbriiglobus sp.]
GITIVNGDVSGHGGGVLSRGGLTMENCAVIANSADEGGGGISSSGHLSVQTSTVAYNDVPVGAIAGPSGGGIELTDGTAAIRYVDISYNEAQEWGGGLYVGEKVDAYLEGVGVSWNGAGNSGGGIMAEGPLYMVEGQIFGNSAKGDGGGLWCGKSGVTYSLDGVEIRSNDAGSRGGGYM